jgi:hypothetical protein
MIRTRRNCLTCVRNAAKILASQTGADKEKFLKGGQLFWSALIYLESWPRDLANRARQIARRFLEHGTVENTANTLEPNVMIARVRELAQCVSELATDIELAMHNGTFVLHGGPSSFPIDPEGGM